MRACKGDMLSFGSASGLEVVAETQRHDSGAASGKVGGSPLKYFW